MKTLATLLASTAALAVGSFISIAEVAEAAVVNTSSITTTTAGVKFNFWESDYRDTNNSATINFISQTHNGAFGLTATSNQGVLVSNRNQNTWGMGVKANSSDDHSIDGKGSKDAITLSFGSQFMAKLRSFTVTSSNTDEIVLSVDDSFVNKFVSDDQYKTFSLSSILSNLATGGTFKFGVDDKDDDYYLKYATFDITETVEQTPVPEPLTLLGTAAALGLGAAMRRRNQEA